MSNPRAIAELFNSYFVEIAEKLTDQNIKYKNKYIPTNNIHQSCIRKQSRKGGKES